MKRYNPLAPCEKCGSVRHDVVWHKKPLTAFVEYSPFGRMIPPTPEYAELMAVECRTCGYKEEFLPLDAKVDDPARNTFYDKDRAQAPPKKAA